MSNHDPIRDALRRRAEVIGGDDHPLALDDVKGRARGIRRRRVAVSGLAAAAVLAVAVPAGIALDEQVVRPSDSGPAATPGTTATPGATPSATPTGVAEPGLLTTDVTATSGEPGIPYVYDGAIHLPDGSEVPVEGEYDEVVPLGDGWVAVGPADDGERVVAFLDAGGDVTDSAPSTGSLAVSADGTVVAYATPAGTLMTVTAGAEPVQLKAPGTQAATILPRAVVGSGSCEEDGPRGCTVFYDDATSGTASYVTSAGLTDRAGDLLSVGGVAEDGRLTGIVTRRQDLTTCSAMLAELGEELWRTCDHQLGAFSPDGRYVLGRPSVGDGSGDAGLAILDAETGTVVAELRNDAETQAFINRAVWDEDGTVLATVYEKGAWSLMRISPGGELTSVQALTGGDDVAPPLHFAVRP